MIVSDSNASYIAGIIPMSVKRCVVSNYPAYICRIAALIQEIKDNLSPGSMSHALEYMHKESGKLLAPPKSQGLLNSEDC